jgi:aquaporin Z
MKRYLMEFIGTFFVAMAITLISNPITIGMMLMAMIYIGGHISGAHFNPAVSFACFVHNKLKLADLGWYIVAQSLGACLAIWFFGLITNNPYSIEMVPGNLVVGPMALEGLLILVLCWVYLVMNFGRHKDSHPGIVIGLTLMAIAAAGSLFNPAVAIASTACSLIKDRTIGEMGSILVYIVGPLIGGAVASFLFGYFKTQD